MSGFLQLLVNGLVTGSIIAISAVGLTFMFGILGVVNFAYGDYLTFGAYMAFVANVTLGWPIALAAVFAMAATAMLGLALELVLWAPMRRRRAGTVSLFITSIGLALVLRDVILLIWGADGRRYDVNLFQVYDLGVVRLSLSQLATIAIATPAIVFVGVMLKRSRLGKAMRATTEDAPIAAAFGVNEKLLGYLISGLAAAVAAVAGLCLALNHTLAPVQIYAWMGVVFAAVMMGGVGSPIGPLVAGIVIGVSEALTMAVSNPTWAPLVSFSLLIAILLFRPARLS